MFGYGLVADASTREYDLQCCQYTFVDALSIRFEQVKSEAEEIRNSLAFVSSTVVVLQEEEKTGVQGVCTQETGDTGAPEQTQCLAVVFLSVSIAATFEFVVPPAIPVMRVCQCVNQSQMQPVPAQQSCRQLDLH